MTDDREQNGGSSAFVKKPNPFVNMHISDNEFLKNIQGRQLCSKCNKSRKLFCYTCYTVLDNVGPFPKVKVSITKL